MAKAVETTRLCPKCGAVLVIRTNSKDQTRFLGCSAYPACAYTGKLPVDLELRALGAPGLFDDEKEGIPVGPEHPAAS